MTAMEQPKTWDPRMWVNRGASLIENDPRVAQRLIQHGIKHIPEEALCWFNLGLALHHQGDIPAAIRAYKHSLALPNPPWMEASNNLGQELLLSGAFQEGWELYERRLKQARFDNRYFEERAGAAWSGFDDPRLCNELVLVAEQGFGDTLQFMRLGLQLQQQGMRIRLFCQPQLTALLQEATEIEHVSDRIDPDEFTEGTRWCPLMSLPHRLKLDETTIPYTKGYMSIDADRVELWEQELRRDPNKLLIGLHWQGNIEHEQKLYSRGRSMPFEALEGFAGLDNIEFVAVQKGDALQQLDPDMGLTFVDGQDTFNASMDFRDTAAVLKCCDLLISADSGVVHLAGALGIPTWVALRWVPEWRWGLNGSSTAWYSTLKLFRQRELGDWASVIDPMRRDLETLVKG